MLIFIEVENYPELGQSINKNTPYSIDFSDVEKLTYTHLKQLLIERFAIKQAIRELRLRSFGGPINSTTSYVINDNTNLGRMGNNDTIIIMF